MFQRNKPERKTSGGDLNGDLTFPDEKIVENDAVIRCLSPMLTCMKLFGAYFQRGGIDNTMGRKAQRFYSMAVLTLLWLNGLRFLFVYTQNDSLDSKLLLKIALSALQILCAILHTSYFFASESGRLDNILKEVQMSPECLPIIRKLTICCILSSFVNILIFSIFFAYLLFFTGGSFDFLLTPFVTHIQIDVNIRYVLKAGYFICYFYMVPCWFLLQGMNHVLAALLYRQFSLLNRRFEHAVGPQGQFNGDMTIYRRRHQNLSLSVKMADSFFMLGNVANFVCHGAILIIILFTVVFCKVWDTVIYVGYWLLGSCNAICLLWTIVDGIMVNHAKALDSKTMFQQEIPEIFIEFMVNHEVNMLILQATTMQ